MSGWVRAIMLIFVTCSCHRARNHAPLCCFIVHFFVHALASLVHSPLIHPSLNTCSFAHPFTHPFTHPLTHSFTRLHRAISHSCFRMLDSSSFSGARVLRAFRVFRPLRLVANIDSLKIEIDALTRSIPQMINVALLFMFFLVLCVSPSVSITLFVL
jgi:hypothetical protein